MVVEFFSTIGSYIEILNHWLSENKLLVFSVAIPTLSYFASKRFEERSIIRAAIQRQHERNLQKELRLADLREKRIDELRVDLTKIAEIDILRLINDDNVGKKHNILETLVNLRLRVPRGDPDYERFESSFSEAMDRILILTSEDSKGKSSTPKIEPLIVVGHDILCRWERELESRLRNSDQIDGSPT